MKKRNKKWWHNKCWRLWSLYRRLKASNHEGYCRCITCGKFHNYKEMNLGHLRHGVLDFDEINTNPQCVYCNQYQSGQRDLYYIWAVKTHGQKAVDDMYIRASMAMKGGNYSVEYLQLLFDELTQKLEVLNANRIQPHEGREE